MAVKLFIKEHITYIIFQVCLTIFLMALLWLDGFRKLDTAIYAVVINGLLIVSFLLVRYMLRRRYLSKIVNLYRFQKNLDFLGLFLFPFPNYLFVFHLYI